MRSGLDFAPDLPGGLFYLYESRDVGEYLGNGAQVPDVNGDGSRVDTVRYRYEQYGGDFETNSLAWYLEDTWDLSDSITIALGVRNESFENFNGVGDKFFEIDSGWAPRFALSWKPGGSDEHQVTLNWGRYYLPAVAYPVVAFGSAALDQVRYFVHDGDRDPETAAPLAIDENGVPTTQEIGSLAYWSNGTVPEARGALDTSLEPMFQDEWMVGYARNLGENWSAGVRVIRRDLQSLIEDVWVTPGLAAIDFPNVGAQQGCQYVLTNPGTDMTTFCDYDGDGSLQQITIPADALGYPKAKRTYEALELTFGRRRADDWALQGSYTLSRSKGNVEAMVKSDNEQAMVNFTEDFDEPQLMDGAYGYLPNDRRHKIKLWGAYEVNDRLTLSANAFAQSGRPINTFGRNHPDRTPQYGGTFYLEQPDGSFEFVPRGSQGRTDWVTQLDLAAIYAFDWGDFADVELRAEVFNVFDSDSATSIYEHAEEQPELLHLPTEYQPPRHLRFGLALRF